MRLLGKNQITLLKSEERRMEIEEGAKLATKVDELRKLEAQERKNLTLFREESLRIIQQEIQSAHVELADIREEIKTAKEEYEAITKLKRKK